MTASAANGLGRDDEAVVLPGSADPALLGVPPDRLVAFRWESGWARVPIQVDERAMVDFATIYGDPEPSGFTVLAYTDPRTFTGPDPDPSLDADDEIVFRVRDAGTKAPGQAGVPAGTVPGSGLEVAVANPSTDAVAWIYLFRGDETLDPIPPSPDVVYDFVLLSGDYKQTYDTGGGTGRGNPETSTVTTPSYRVGFSDRWLRVETAITRGGAPGTDLLERHRNRFRPDSCTRTEWTFSMGEGAFIVNKNGPVRALRAYVGANSGVTTHRIHEFYESTEVIRTVLRVHEIPGVMDFFDWDASASGMTWRNDLNPQGVPVDGVPDTVTAGAYGWESISGPQGSLAMVPAIDTDIPNFAWTSWYSDSIPAQAGPCDQQGDDNEAYGSSGIWRQGAVANTDPGVAGDVYRFVFTRTLRYLGPSAPETAGAELRHELLAPVTVAFSAYLPSEGCFDGDGDGWADCGDGCEPPAGISCGDCDDTDAAVRPTATESCNGRDDDCDAAVDEDLPLLTWYRDADDDGWGDPSDPAVTCDTSAPNGRVARAGDCDDADPARNPDAPEVCDGLDQDCDGLADDGLPFDTWYRDADDDGFGNSADATTTCDGAPPDGHVATGGDCDDADPARNPGSSEVCNGVDDDCDGARDEDLVFTTWYRDSDGDGFGSSSSTTKTCGGDPPAGYAAVATDCDDDRAEVHPGAPETCNGRDDDCDTVVDEDVPDCGAGLCADADGDGWSPCAGGCEPQPGAVCGDCDDGDAGRNPAASETCDGRDDDCDGATDDGIPLTQWFADADGDGAGSDASTITTCDASAPDGYAESGGDCDDEDATVRPGAAEACDGVDNDCAPSTGDGASEPWLGEPCDGADTDTCSTGFSICDLGARGCDDDPAASVDVCDGADNDCDGLADNPSCGAFDVDGNSTVDGFELAWLGRAFGDCRTGNESPWWAPVDYDGDGCVDGGDLVILANLWARDCLDGSLCP